MSTTTQAPTPLVPGDLVTMGRGVRRYTVEEVRGNLVTLLDADGRTTYTELAPGYCGSTMRKLPSPCWGGRVHGIARGAAQSAAGGTDLVPFETVHPGWPTAARPWAGR